MSNKIETSLPAKLTYLPVLQQITSSYLQVNEIGEEDQKNIDLVVEEALLTILSTSLKNAINQEICFSIDIRDQSLILSFKDMGEPYDFSQLDHYKNELSDEDKLQKGLSLFIIKKLMNRVDLLNLGKKGHELKLVRYLNKYQEPQELIVEEDLSHLNFSLTFLPPEKAILIAQSAYQTYGHSYLYEDVYYPERISAKIQEGTFISAGALSDDDRLLGHTALIMDDNHKSGELGVAFVHPKVRGKGFLQDLTLKLIEDAQLKNLEMIYVTAVTSHIYSQKAAAKFQFKDMAILIGCGSELNMKGINEISDHRESFVIMGRYFSTKLSRKIYSPLKHQEIIFKTLDYLGLSENQSTVDHQHQAHHKDLEITTSLYNTAKIYAYDLTSDLPQRIKKIKFDLTANSAKGIYLYLNLNHPLLPKIYDQLEALDFIYAGITCEYHDQDWLILQHLNGFPIEFEKININTDFGKTIQSYIQQEYIKLTN